MKHPYSNLTTLPTALRKQVAKRARLTGMPDSGLRDNMPPHRIIDYAFSWDDSAERHLFWSRVCIRCRYVAEGINPDGDHSITGLQSADRSRTFNPLNT